MLYEIQDISRFATVGQFCSYARLVHGSKESAGKKAGPMGRKIGNAHLKWAFSEAVCLMMRELPQAKAYVEHPANKHGKGKAMSMLAHKLGRALYYMLKRNDAFDVKYFFANERIAEAGVELTASNCGHSGRARMRRHMNREAMGEKPGLFAFAPNAPSPLAWNRHCPRSATTHKTV